MQTLVMLSVIIKHSCKCSGLPPMKVVTLATSFTSTSALYASRGILPDSRISALLIAITLTA